MFSLRTFPLSLLAFVLGGCSAASPALASAPQAVLAAAAVAPSSLEGDWVMHLYIGQKLFDDRLHLARDAQGKLGGTLTVVGNFTAPIEKLRVAGRKLSFEILAPEGAKPFRVAYEGELDGSGEALVGFATLLADHSLLGGFVAQKEAK